MIKTFQGENRYLSNFFPATVSMIPPFGDSQEMVKAKTSEHLYQAFKADNEEEFYEILDAKTPGEAKRMGEKCSLRDDWEDIKLYVMYRIVRRKFLENHDLAEKLIKTEGLIEEGNHWGDQFWGVCRGKGENHLGKILMQVRAEILGYHRVMKFRQKPKPASAPIKEFRF